jgi:hypothetical protein
MEVSFVSTITRFSVRSSGRDLTVVRRPEPAKKSRKPKQTPELVVEPVAETTDD